MSRIIVKNIGKNTNESNLRDIFSQKGEVTDVKVIRDKLKKVSRRFAFVGFRTDLQATEAQKYFNGTFIGQSRISVEIARKFNDCSLKNEKDKRMGRSTKNAVIEKHAASESKYGASDKDKKGTGFEAAKAPMSKKKAEFLEIMKKRDAVSSWDNDAIVPGRNELETFEPIHMSENIKAIEGEANGESKGNDSDSDDDFDVNSINDLVPGTVGGEGKAVAEGTNDPPMSDMDYLRSKVRSALSDSDSDGSESDSDSDDSESESHREGHVNGKSGRKASTKGAVKVINGRNDTADEPHDGIDSAVTADAPAESGEDSILKHEDDEDDDDDDIDSSRLFVKNLPFSCAEQELCALFEPFGPLSAVHMPLDDAQRGKGFAFVQFMLPESADRALQELTGSSFQGRVLYVKKARALQQPDASVAGQKGIASKSRLSSFQQKKEDERRKALDKKEGWNASFVRSDAVVDSLAARHGVSSADILDTSKGGGEMAVRLAIGESHVVMENKEYFAAHGVDINALESSTSQVKVKSRSDTTLLVKNLPAAAGGATADAGELESMFARFGALAAFLMPPSRTMALVEFVEPSEARAAHRGLAYRKYKHAPLYLEWAPLNVIDKTKAPKKQLLLLAQQAKKDKQNKSTSKASATSVSTTGTSNEEAMDVSDCGVSGTVGTRNQEEKKIEGVHDDDEEVEDDDGGLFSSVFIKNLNFISTEESLRAHILRLGLQGLRTVKIQTKSKAPVGSGGKVVVLSQGYGFAEFKTSEQAIAAVQRLHKSVLDSHALEAKPSDKRLTPLPAGSVTRVPVPSSSSASKKRHQTADGTGGGSGSGGVGGTKIIVRNVAFQASKSEIRALFAAFGSVRRVRIPQKMGGEHRGFAFVDFSTAQEAAAAVQALRSTHLYGRHLILDWAKETEEDTFHNQQGQDQSTVRSGSGVGGAGGSFGGSLEQLRKKARLDQRVIETQRTKQRVQVVLDGSKSGGWGGGGGGDGVDTGFGSFSDDDDDDDNE